MGVQSVSTTDEEAGFEASGNEWIGRRVCRWEADDCILGTCRSWRSAESIVEQAFNAVDDDGSGLLDRDEVTKLISQILGEAATPSVLTSNATAFISRAVDDSGNLEPTKAGAAVAAVAQAPSMGPNPAVPLLLTGKETLAGGHDEL